MICDGTDMNDNFFALFLDFAIDYLRERERLFFFFLFLSAEVFEKNIEIFLCFWYVCFYNKKEYLNSN
jgi:hypothetical protein